VVLSPAEAEEHPKTVRLSSSLRAMRRAIPLAMFCPYPHPLLTQTFEVIMQLSRKKVLLLLGVAFTTACRETVAPLPGTISAFYVLQTFNGQPLPTIQRVVPPGDTVRVLLSTIAFDRTAQAKFSDDLLVSHLSSPPTRSTVTYTLGYRITDDNVVFYCIGPLDCIGQLVGTFAGTTLTLSGGLDQSLQLFKRSPQIG
jgi:hypothetical protein